MVEIGKRKGGGKLLRSETVTVRLDPKLRYLAELAARRERRTLSSYIEWAIEDSLKHRYLDQGANSNSLADEAETLWDVDEADRFARLALRHPELLTHEEQILWKLVRENGYLWRGKYALDGRFVWNVQEQSLIFERLRENWAVFCNVAETSAGYDKLPTWCKELPPKDDMDDEIPF